MGYVRQRPIYKLVFADEDMDGLEVRARSVPLGVFLRIEEITGKGSAPTDAEVKELFESFAESLISWNLEEPVDPDDPDGDKRPVPATVEGLYSHDLEFIVKIILSWQTAVAEVPAPLGRRSPNGGLSPVPSLPMEPLSGSQAS